MTRAGDPAQALAACLDELDAAGLAAAADLACRADAPEDLAELVDLAGALRALPDRPAASEAFRDRLAAALATAPAPASLAAGTAATPPAALPTVAVVNDLDACLQALATGRATPEALLAQRPDDAVELAPLLALAAALDELPAVPAPGAAFRRRLAAELASAPPPAGLARRPAAGAGFLRRLSRSTAFAAGLAAALVLFLAMGAGFASADALPGQPLYPMKRLLETARLWVASGEAEIALHLDLADRRLAEAWAVPAEADAALAEFSGEVMAALARADRALAAGAPRRRVVDPLLARLLGAREALVTARGALPPTAWRSALALVDTAIGAFRADDLAGVPILRQFGPGGRPVAGGLPPAASPALVAAGLPTPTPTPVTLALAGASSGGGAGAGSGPGPVAVAPPAAATPGATATAPTREGGPPVVTATARPRPSATDRPGPAPSATTVTPPTAIATQPTVPTARPTEPVQPSETPLPVPSPTSTPDKLPPEIRGMGPVGPPVISLGGAMDFTVEAVDPDGGPLTYRWTTSWGEMLDADKPTATFHAVGNLSGMSIIVIVSVEVTDQTGTSATAETTIEVSPRTDSP